MTNFQQDNAQGRFAWLTPERALVLLPAAVGLTFALILGGALVVRFQPLLFQVLSSYRRFHLEFLALHR